MSSTILGQRGVGGSGTYEEQLAGSTRFYNIRYKIYIFLLCVVGFFIYPTVLDAYTSFITSYERVGDMDFTIQRTIEKQNRYAEDFAFLKNVDASMKISEGQTQAPLISCINQEIACDQFEPILLESLSTLRSYVQLNSLETDKMEIDEKKILKSINEFLLQKDPFSRTLAYNGELLSVTIGDSIQEEGLLYSLPVDLRVRFDTKEKVLSYLQHIEDHVFYHETFGLEGAVLYKIDSLNYDVMNYDTQQEIDVAMTAYRYKSQSALF